MVLHVTESSVWSLLNWRYHTSMSDLSKHSTDLGSVRMLGVSISQKWWQLRNHQKMHPKHFVFTVKCFKILLSNMLKSPLFKKTENVQGAPKHFILLRFSNNFSETAENFFRFMLTCKILFSYLQLWQSYDVLSATTHRIFTFHNTSITSFTN